MIPNPVHDFKVKVRDLEFLYWSLCLSFYNVCFCEVFDGLIHVWHCDRNWSKIYMVPFPTQKVTDSEFLYKSFVINVLQFQVFFAKPSMDFIQLWRDNRALFKILCSTIPIPVHDLKTLNFFVLNLYSVRCCKAFDWYESCLVWMDIRF